ncbi:MAG TPA: putative glycoside hydrolase [Turneriella sp.]|nr:putative glycoside hydrolase [Turneriella sp.]
MARFRILFVLAIALFTSCSSAQTKAAEPTADKKNYLRGLYIPVRKTGGARSVPFVKSLVERGKPLGLNAVALDAQTFKGMVNKINPEVVAYLKGESIYTIARVVCFQDGIQKLPVAANHMKKLRALIAEVSQMGFDEINLDYIRFEDAGTTYPLKKKYEFLDNLLAEFRTLTAQHNIKLSADVFGRIVYNEKDSIGQNIENYAKHTDVIYPMLYPSHFTKDKKRMSDPGFTVSEGTEKAIERLKGTTTEIMPWVQVFVYNIQYARVKLSEYVFLQIEALEKTQARGWIAWNAKAEYKELFQAMEKLSSGRQ